VALPSTEAKLIWPPSEGYTIAFWINHESQSSHTTKDKQARTSKAISVTNIDLRDNRDGEDTLIFTLNSINNKIEVTPWWMQPETCLGNFQVINSGSNSSRSDDALPWSQDLCFI